MPPRKQRNTAVRYPDPARPIEQQDELILLAMLIFGEARGASAAAKLGVAHTVRNRVRCSTPEFGLGYREVCLKPRQFSCFNAGDPNRAKLLDPLATESARTWEECYAVAQQVYGLVDGDGRLALPAGDPTAGATHYFDASLDDNPPKWAAKFEPTVKIGRLRFFRDPSHKLWRAE